MCARAHTDTQKCIHEAFFSTGYIDLTAYSMLFLGRYSHQNHLHITAQPCSAFSHFFLGLPTNMFHKFISIIVWPVLNMTFL